MSDNPIMGMKEQQKRRARIQRMKITIIGSIFGWMIISMAICIFLGVRVFSLNQQVNKLYDFIVSEATGGISQTPLPEQDLSETVGENINIQFNTDISNLADEDSIHKVYLTFDDGPSENTDDILDILARYDVKATFFVVGKTDEHSLAMYKRIVEEGHTLGLHSYTHKYSSLYSSVIDFEQDLKLIHDLIYETTGVDSKIYRFPGGSSNMISDVLMKDFIHLLNKEGYTYYDWNVVSGDATVQNFTAQDLVDNVINGVEKYETSIVLMHDATRKVATVEALPTIIEELLAMNAQILPIDDETVLIQHLTIETEE